MIVTDVYVNKSISNFTLKLVHYTYSVCETSMNFKDTRKRKKLKYYFSPIKLAKI